MSEAAAASAAGDGRTSPGAMLRAARERTGLHIGALAATLKVPVRRLEALEADLHAELTDATFVRTLTLSVCRQLRVDPQPILALQPQADAPALVAQASLAQMASGASLVSVAGAGSVLRQPVAWVVVVLLLGALAFVVSPEPAPGAAATAEAPVASGSGPSVPAAPSVPAVTSATGAAPAPSMVVEPAVPAVPAAPPSQVPTVAANPVPNAAPNLAPAPAAGASFTPATPSPAPPAGVSMLRLSASGSTWFEVIDGKGAVLQRGTLQAGDTAVANGTPPLKVTVGRADRVQVSVRGQPFDVGASTRDNVARFEVK
jgi:cytoskeleton protein RodZ